MEKKSIALIGMAGAGKSTIGKQLAVGLGLSFTDLDEFIAAQEGETIQQIIDHRGEAALLQLEEKHLLEIKLEQRVIAPGGSIIYRASLMDFLKERSILVFLDEPFETIRNRLTNAGTRGIVGYPEKSLQEIYAERRPLYIRYADLMINPQGKTPIQIVSEIIHTLSHGQGRIQP